MSGTTLAMALREAAEREMPSVSRHHDNGYTCDVIELCYYGGQVAFDRVFEARVILGKAIPLSLSRRPLHLQDLVNTGWEPSKITWR